MNLDDLNWGVWTRTGVLNRETTGYDRNHNCGFLRDPYGYLPAGAISVMYTGAKGKADGVAPFCRLWSYTIYTHQLDTPAK